MYLPSPKNNLIFQGLSTKSVYRQAVAVRRLRVRRLHVFHRFRRVSETAASGRVTSQCVKSRVDDVPRVLRIYWF